MIPNVTDDLRNQSLKYHSIQTLFYSRTLRIFHCGSWVFQSFNFLALDSSEVWLSIIRSSRPEVFCKKDAHKNFLKFTGKYLCQSLFSNKFAGLRLLAKYVENFLPKRWYKQNNFFYFTDGWNSYFKGLINNYITLKFPFFNTPPPPPPPPQHTHTHPTITLFHEWSQDSPYVTSRLIQIPPLSFFLFFEDEKKIQRYASSHDTFTHLLNN